MHRRKGKGAHRMNMLLIVSAVVLYGVPITYYGLIDRTLFTML